jgi:hypothetical protein
MTCIDCVHYLACSAKGGLFNEKDDSKEMLCRFFFNKRDCAKVVRCKDCKHYDGGRFCYYSENTVLADDFCSYGERSDT